MEPPTRHRVSARDMVPLVEPFGPAVHGEELVFEVDPSADLDRVLGVLHTGVRALLAGRRWYGCDGQTGRVYELNPAAPIPGNVTLLGVEGDSRWDRIDPAVRLDCPGLFAPPPRVLPGKGRLGHRSVNRPGCRQSLLAAGISDATALAPAGGAGYTPTAFGRARRAAT